MLVLGRPMAAAASTRERNPDHPCQLRLAIGLCQQQHAFVQRHRPFGTTQQSGTQPALEAVGVPDDSGQGDRLGLDAFAPAHPEKRQQELQVRAASLVGVGYLAAQYQQELFYAAAICLGASAFIMVRQRRAQSCAPGAACARPLLDWGSKIALVLAVGFLVLTFWIEPPI